MFTPWDFDKYGNRYARLFESIYPSRNSTGFPERNLTVNLCGVHEQEATSVFEMQFGSNNREHLDGVMLSDNSKIGRLLALIESKRYKAPSAIQMVGRDIGRIYRFYYELKKESLSPKTQRIEMSSVSHVIGCVLADVWIENRFKKDVVEAYKTETFLDVFEKDIFAGIVSGLQLPPKYSVQVSKMVFDQVRKTIKYNVQDACSSNWPNDYYLVSFFWEIEDEKYLSDAFFDSINSEGEYPEEH